MDADLGIEVDVTWIPLMDAREEPITPANVKHFIPAQDPAVKKLNLFLDILSVNLKSSCAGGGGPFR